MKKILLRSSIILLLLVCANVSAEKNSNFSDAEKLINNWFSAMIEGNTDKAKDMLAPEFIGLDEEGIARNKQAMLSKKMRLKSYKLTDFQFSQSGDIIIVTYKNTGTEEMVGNQVTLNKPTPRMTILQKQGDKWLIVAHANLAPIKK